MAPSGRGLREAVEENAIRDPRTAAQSRKGKASPRGEAPAKQVVRGRPLGVHKREG